MEISEKILIQLTDEQRKRAESAKSAEELLTIAKEEGYELSEEQINDIAGGAWNPHCNSFCYAYA